uniref:RNA helicase n=1 Tax=Rhabditophanes sp. KR3021 TaxID=114890 RepID=A0AC35TW83_9BILA
MFRHIKDQAPLDEGDGPIAIIMTPTRELALQIWKEAKKFANLLKLNVVAVYGGVGISEQIADLKRQPEIIVCTPGRMIEMLTANSGKVTNLRRVTYCVLDEADRMFDLGFEPQVMKILANIRPNKQLLLFSATFPKQMDGLARKVLKAPVEIQVGGKSIVCKDVNQNVLIVEEQQKFLKLLELLGIYSQTGSVLVFVEKQEKSEELVNMLIKSNYMAAPLHGGVNQDDRNSTIVDFKSGVLTLMVATSVAARGLDVKNLKLVVNYDCPNHYEDYVHRVGRTGRAGNKGFAYTFIMPEGQEKMAGELVRAFESAGSKAPSELKEMYTKWKKQMKTEGKNTRIGTGGFGGSGFKYDALEDEATINKRRMQKLVLGIENNVMDDDGEIEEQLITMLKSTKTYLEKGAVNSMLVKGGNGNSNSTNEPTPTVSEGKMERAKAAAAKINAAKAPQSEQPTVAPTPSGSTITAPNVMTGSTIQINISAASLAKQKADQLNERLNYVPTENSNLYDLPDNVHFYEEELEINEFPQQVRYKVCSRDSIKQIQEFADVGISVKGSHIIGNREPHAGERKLYLFIEARDEISLRRAKEEILRIMKDAFRQIGAANRGGTQSRYKVV